VRTIQSVAQAGHVHPPQMTSTLFPQIASVAVASGQSEALDAARMTTRERQVINLISEGLGNKQIAAYAHRNRKR